jgi:CRP/FNR family transcriptional regulator, cyclic AMP receptor protein
VTGNDPGGRPRARGVSVPDVDRLLKLARRRRFRRGEVIFHEGDTADSVHLIEAGHVASQTTTEEGGIVTYRIFGPGEMLGLLGLQSGQTGRYGTAVALEPTVTHAISAERLRAVSWADPAMTQMVVDLLATEIRTFAAALVEALFVPVETRVLRRIVALCELYGQGAETATVPLTQNAIAGLAGTSRATVNRVMKSLEEVGAIQRRRSAFIVVDLNAVARATRNARQVSR